MVARHIDQTPGWLGIEMSHNMYPLSIHLFEFDL